ncbi:hypothetical protein [Brevibacillus daliensis]|uniref:hypothetical protein n=1 Tax=Brevibacillus daliensis TaxID=2892995 RepID=UPI001E446D5E|nr:hypothetical protein [Brevibacillus daliensis]
MKPNGFVIVPRFPFEKEFDQVVFNLLIAKANYKDSDSCKRGQCILSLRSVSEFMMCSFRQIDNAIKRLSDMNLIHVQKSKVRGQGTIITIFDYDKFQSLPYYANENETVSETQNDNKKPYSYGAESDNFSSSETESGTYRTTSINSKKDKKEYILVDFPIDRGAFLKIYNDCFRERFGRNHMKVSQSQLERIMDLIDEIEELDIDEEMFEDGAIQHLNNLPEGNNGHILPFLMGYYRHFEYY